MAYYLETSESFSEGIKRAALEQHNMAIDALANDDSLHNGIHKARKHFKKLRALYRLVRDEVGHGAYQEGNVFYRGMGRKLAPLRDITSRIETVGLLQEQFGGMVNAQVFDTLLALLDEERHALQEKAVEGDHVVEETIELLRNERNRFLELPIRDQCLDNIISSIRRVYNRGYKGFGRSLDNPTLEDMHEWRKRVKYLWYHYRLLRQAWPRVIKAYKKETKVLAGHLGDFHDLGLLQAKMKGYGERLPQEAQRVLSAIAQGHQQHLLEQSRQLGERVYIESPDAFANRIESLIDGVFFNH